MLALVLGIAVLRDDGRAGRTAASRSATPNASLELRLTHGVASGDVSSTGAIVWARANKPARMVVEVATNPGFRRGRRFAAGIAGPATDYTVSFRVRKLRPATRHHYRIWFSDLAEPSVRTPAVTGTFKTAPAPDRRASVRIAFSGDVGSSNYCRHAEYGYPIFHYIGRRRPDFFVSLGDLIYADSGCSAQGPDRWRNLPAHFATVDDRSLDWTDRQRVQDVYFDHWRYTRADKQLIAFLANTPIYSVWDDHEVINDFGARWDAWLRDPERRGFPNLVAAGRNAFFSYGVLGRRKRDPNRQYRSFTWGRDLKLLLTDTRSYRSRNDELDTPATRKTMLGAAQLAWLKRSLSRATATWKVVASSVSVAVPTGSNEGGRDGWADGGTRNGFERELIDLLQFLDQRDVRNVIFIVADLHFAQATRHRRDYDGDGDALVFHELVAGPLNARTWHPYWLDQTTNPTALYGEGDFFNFGFLQVLPQRRGKALLRAETVDSFGKTKRASVLVLRPS